ncbi:Digalactosyldiacylglycerol synthase 1 chloroplastic [Zea mays]|uniref:Digalactosyldiacylglycerol synthase 1 chloroplastic n=1 Tax=Zea mays TaxID=4577 RepID=A0A1D6EGM3_MAIZE|nr:Digalactosyldiacylglycerol synthase 1 chloroplastic [Zea mays]
MASPVVVVAALLAAALAAFCGTDPLRTGSMVDFPGFEPHLVDLPDPTEMPMHADERERLRGAEVRFHGGKIQEEKILFNEMKEKGVKSGYRELIDLMAKHKSNLEGSKLDVYRSGEDSQEVQSTARRYKVFKNPSISDVLCTTTSEALAMGKFVICAEHPSNEFLRSLSGT